MTRSHAPAWECIQRIGLPRRSVGTSSLLAAGKAPHGFTSQPTARRAACYTLFGTTYMP